MRLARPAAILVLACTAALALAACGTVAGTSVPAPAISAATPATSAAALAGTTPSQSASPRPTRPPATSSRSPHPGPGRSSLPSVRTAPHYRASTSAAIHADHVIGDGSPAGCTSSAVVGRRGGRGDHVLLRAQPVTIVMTATAKVRNTSTEVVLDGGGKVTLSGGGARRILYQDTCDPAQTWSTSHCQDQATPHLVVQNLTLADGNSTGQTYDGGGGGAIFDRGGQLTVINSHFTGNRCDSSGPDLGGAAIRALSQYQNQPVYVVGSTFTGGVCSNGGALSSIGVSWTVLNDIMTGNQAIGDGANPAQSGTPGGGSGGAIYNDGDTYTLTIDGSVISGNSAREGGGAVFYVSNDHTGTMSIDNSRLTSNPNAGFQTSGFPGIFFLGRGQPVVLSSSLS